MSTLTVYGGAGEVTGANILLDTGETRILIDCGLHQGESFDQGPLNRADFAYEPGSVDVLLVTHAHTDHIGRIPLLVKKGFKGEIYTTPETRSLSQIVLEDAVSIFESEQQKTGVEPLYSLDDVERAMRNWKTVDFHEALSLKGCSALFIPTGHILGAASIVIERGGKKMIFSGDIGNAPDVLLPAPEPITNATYLLTESVYGDRLHDDLHTRGAKLRDEIVKVHERGGTLLIPCFAVHRTQALLCEIGDLYRHAQAPIIPVFLDAPLAIKATEIYRHAKHLFNPDALERLGKGGDIFSFSQLTFVQTAKESAHIAEVGGPKIIIAGSGMSVGGRVISHEANLLSDRKTTILFVGYQAPGTLGRRIQDGIKRVRIGDRYVTVHARVAVIHGYSGHADRDQLFAYAAHSAKTLKKIFVTMGEMKASSFLAQRFNDELGIEAVVPAPQQSFTIDF
jgi:metallo-beta-lactamase family protein